MILVSNGEDELNNFYQVSHTELGREQAFSKIQFIVAVIFDGVGERIHLPWKHTHPVKGGDWGLPLG